jgi:hypothetical protein
MIKTWQERCEEHPDHEGIVSEQMICDRMQEEIDELRQAIAEAEKQKPVGYVSEPGSCTEVGTNSGVLHTEWVGLTDDEFQACFDHADGTLGSLMYAIEAKLKEKNT